MKKQFSGQSSLNKKNRAIALLMIVVFVASGFFISVPQSFALVVLPSQGPNDPQTVGWSSGGKSWSNYDRIKTSNDQYASVSLSDNSSSKYIEARNFGFNIPSGSVISGITVDIERKVDKDNTDGCNWYNWHYNEYYSPVRDEEVKIINANGDIVGNNKATATNYPKTDTYESHGSQSDLWGLSLSSSNINDSDFGVAIKIKKNGDGCYDITASIDHVRMTVYYTIPNTAPVANTDSYSVDEDNTLNVSAAGVLANDTDANSDPLTAILVSGVSHGSLTLNSDGSFAYAPAANYFGADSFTYKANDGKADSNVVTANIAVNAINDAPVISSVSISPTNPKTNDTLTASVVASDIDGGALSYTYNWKKNGEDVVASGSVLNLAISGNGDKTDSISVNVVANDGAGGTDSKSAEAVVIANTAPVAQSNGLSVSEDGTASFSLSASDDDNDSLNYIIVDGPTNGSLTGEAPNLTYTPAENYKGTDSLTFKANDGTEDSNVATININVNSENDNPVLAGIGDKTVAETAELSFTASASDVDGDALQYYLSKDAPEGAAINSETGAFAWTPSEEQGGAAYTFDVIVSDGQGGIDSETITVTVNEVNLPPVSQNLEITTDEDTALKIELSGSDADVPANVLTYSILGNPANGVIADFDAAKGTLTYTPNSNFHGSDMFFYTVSDGVYNSATSTVYIGVQDIAPVVVSAIYTSPTTVKITFDEGLQNNETHSPKIADFKIYRRLEGAEIAISGIAHADKEKVVTLTLAEAINADDAPVYQVLPMLIPSTIIDEAGNQITQIVQGDLIKEDKTAPIINLNGAAEITLTVGDAYLEQGATWIDDFDGTGSTTEISGTVDTNTAGVYTVKYNKTDAAGNKAEEKSRIITVKAKSNPTEPSAPAVGGGGGSSHAVYTCVSVNYGEWGTCANGLQYRDVLSQNPTYCTMTAEQQALRSKSCAQNPVPEQQVLGVKKYADGTLLRGATKKIYLVVGGILRHILDLKELAKYAGKEIINVDQSVIDAYPKGAVLGTKRFGKGQLIRNNNVKVYVIVDGGKRHILDIPELAKYHFGKPIFHVSEEELTLY